MYASPHLIDFSCLTTLPFPTSTAANDALVVKPAASPASLTPVASRRPSLRTTPEPEPPAAPTVAGPAAARQLELQLELCSTMLACPPASLLSEPLAAVHDLSVAYALARGIVHRIHDVMALLDRPVQGAEVPSYIAKALGVLEALVAPPLSATVLVDTAAAATPTKKLKGAGTPSPAPGMSMSTSSTPGAEGSEAARRGRMHQNISGVLVFFQETSLVRLTSMLASLLLQSQNAAVTAAATPPPAALSLGLEQTPTCSPSRLTPPLASGRVQTPLSPNPSSGPGRSTFGRPPSIAAAQATPAGAVDASFFLPPNFPEVATAALRVLNRVAELDLSAFQEIAGAPDLRIEVYLIIQSLLSLTMQKMEGEREAAADRSEPRRNGAAEAGASWHSLLREVMKLTASFVLQRPSHHQSVQWGKSPTILQNLCALGTVLARRTQESKPSAPQTNGNGHGNGLASLFGGEGASASGNEDMRLLLCTLLSCCIGSERNALLLQGEYERGRGVISLKHLQEFLLSFLDTGPGASGAMPKSPAAGPAEDRMKGSGVPPGPGAASVVTAVTTCSGAAAAEIPSLATLPRDLLAAAAATLGQIRI